MNPIYERIVVGNETICRSGGDGIGIVHACKSPCHQRAVGYKGNLPKNHPNYLWFWSDRDLYLNMIDPPVPLFPDDLFKIYLSFARDIWESGDTLLIHCNQGESRAPSLAMIFLAKNVKAISNQSFDHAMKDFLKLFPNYRPGGGIQKYLVTNWEKLDAF